MPTKASIYRMVTSDHLCPWGIKAYDLLKRHGFDIEDHHLESKAANDAYKQEHGVDETPQVFIEGNHLGGYDKLREYLGEGPDPKEGETYQPVMAVFVVSFLMALATLWSMQQGGNLSILRLLELFVAYSMCVLGLLKLQDLLGFATGFVQYDLIARRYVPYSYVYPFVETGTGILMIAGVALWIAASAAFFVSSVGALSVTKAVYIDKRDLNCACVGGGSSVPLGFISLTENLMMMVMAVWMIFKVL